MYDSSKKIGLRTVKCKAEAVAVIGEEEVDEAVKPTEI